MKLTFLPKSAVSCRLFLGLVLLTTVIAVAASAQNTISVPADISTIQGAISSAHNGDTVLVSPGTYVEKINFLGKAITVTSTDGAPVTIIDGTGLGCCTSGVTFTSSETSASVLNGFTVQNHMGTPPQTAAAYGINISNASPTLTNNIVTNNRGGGGINVVSGSPQILRNSITNNFGGSFGGGVFLSADSSALVRDNYIANNSATNGGGGIAIVTFGPPSQSSSLILQNIVVNNTSGQSGYNPPYSGGSGIFVHSAQPKLINNTLYGNTSPQFDSAMAIYSASGTVVQNNVVMAGFGNAIYCGFPDPSVTFSHNLAYSSFISWDSNCSSGPGSNGNLDADPRFVDAVNGNFHLAPGSPAIDAGDIGIDSLPVLDFSGAPRLGDDSGQCNFVIDLGVYQSHSAAPAAISVSPSSLAFPDTKVGAATDPQLITLTSTGQGCYRVKGVSVTGDFSLLNSCGAGVPAGTTCSLQTTFNPTALGARSGAFSILMSTNAGTVPAPVSLSGNGVFAHAVISQSSVNFADQDVNTNSQPQFLTLTNDSTVPLTVSSVSVTGDFTQFTDCVKTIAPGGNCLIQINFSPAASGQRAGALSITSDSNPAAPNVSLSGVGRAPILSYSPASLSFGNQVLGSNSSAQSITLNNVGNGAYTLSGFNVSRPDFTQTNNCPGSIAAGSSCTINVVFTPASTGSISATLTTSGLPAGAGGTVNLSGTGTAPTASVSPASLTFAMQRVGTTSAVQSAVLSNTGSSALNISSITVSGAFTATNNCPASLAAGSSCTISVTFRPTQTGAANGNVAITDDSGGVPGSTQSISLSGTGGASAATVSPSSLTFATTKVGTSSAGSTVILSNSGTMSLNISSISATGDFSQSNNCGFSVAAGGSCVVTVVFTPTTTGSRTGTLTINDDSQSGGVQTVSLSGTGAIPTATLTPGTVTFATTATGTQSASSPVTLRNTGVVSMNVASIVTTGDFTQTNNCPAALAAGASCTINVTFVPTAGGTRTGTLTVTDDASGGWQTVSLTGSATDFSVSVSPTSVSVNQGQTATYNATVAAVSGAYNQTVSLSCSGLPAGSTYTFTPTSVIPGSTSKNSQLKIVTQKNVTTKGTFTIVVTGTVNGMTRSVTATLIVK